MKRPRVLLVDDIPEVLEYCLEILKTDFDVVGTAASGAAAVLAVAASAPDAIVLDISMPGLDGIEVARHLRSTGCGAAIVFLSADDDKAKAALEAGGSAYVSKCRIGADLRQAILQALEGRRLVSEGQSGMA